MRGPVAEIRRNEIENRLKRGLPVNATALAEEFLVSEVPWFPVPKFAP
jgi:hypothetical protein